MHIHTWRNKAPQLAVKKFTNEEFLVKYHYVGYYDYKQVSMF